MSIWLVSTIGITNTIGRVACGVVSSLPGVDALFINNMALTIGGIATILSGVSLSFGYQIFYSSVFGLAMGKKECGHLHILLTVYKRPLQRFRKINF
jgi:hypothetical protein